MPEITYLKGWKRLGKTVTKTGVTTYPAVRKFNSHKRHYTSDQKGFDAFYNDLDERGKVGECLLKGDLKGPLNNEPRKGRHVDDASTDWIVLDFDKVLIPAKKATSFTQTVAWCVESLPPAFHKASYVAQASSSYGLDGDFSRASFHLFFFLATPLYPLQVTDLLVVLNQSQPFEGMIGLTGSKLALSYPIDICTGQASRLIYIAPPTFEPGAEDRDGFVETMQSRLIKKTALNFPLLELTPDNYSPSASSRFKSRKVNDLREASGEPRIKGDFWSTFADFTDGSLQSTPIAYQPGEMEITFAEAEGNYIRYNLNGGDSNAYWVYKTDPAVMRNFKGEPFFSFAAASPTMYAWHMNKFCGETLTVDEGNELKEIGLTTEVPYIVRVEKEDKYYTLRADFSNQTYHTLINANSRQGRMDFIKYCGGVVPDPAPNYEVIYDPTNTQRLKPPETATATGYINKFQPSQYMLDCVSVKATLPVKDAIDSYRFSTPNTYILLNSALGDDRESFEKFILWISYIFQKRDKTGTAWVMHGAQGTGKGLLLDQVLRPLFGDSNTRQIRAGLLHDNFDNATGGTLLLALDEFKINAKDTKTMDKLKNMITEKNTNVRNFGEALKAERNFMNVLLFSNHADSTPVAVTDRRFNIAPLQHTPLKNRVENLELFVSRLQEELPRFAIMLASVEATLGEVQVPLMNSAKREMQELTMTAAETLARALKTCDFEFFADMMEFSTATYGGDAGTLMTAKNGIRKFVNEMANPGADKMIGIDRTTIHALYMVHTSDFSVTTHKVSQALGKHQVKWSRKSIEGRIPRTSVWLPVNPADTHAAQQILIDMAIVFGEIGEVRQF